MRFLLTAATILYAAPALADLGSDCLKAADAGNSALVKQYADMILFSRDKLSEQRAADAAACLLEATGRDYVYAPDVRKFELAEEHDQAAVERQRQAAEKSRVEREKQARKKEAENKAQAEAAEARAAAERFRADMERREAERHQAVAARLSEACTNLYRRDPDATIANKLCFDVFWAQGLPQ